MDTTASPSSVQTSVTPSESPAIVHSSSDFTTSASTVTPSSESLAVVINPQRACAARVTVLGP